MTVSTRVSTIHNWWISKSMCYLYFELAKVYLFKDHNAEKCNVKFCIKFLFDYDIFFIFSLVNFI